MMSFEPGKALSSAVKFMERALITVTLYTRKNCGLCEEVKTELAQLQDEYPHRLVELDIESDRALYEKFFTLIPVLEIGPYTLTAPIDRRQLRVTLGAAIDRRAQLDRIGDSKHLERVRRGERLSTADRLSHWLTQHYLFLLNAFMTFYVGMAFLAPVFMAIGAQGPARLIYRLYSPFCHQFAFRSFFLFGEQFYYPLEAAGLAGIKSFDEISGLTDLNNPRSVDRLRAREFIGDKTAGYKVALCERDVAIYSGMLIFGLLFALTGRRLRPLNWLVWLFFGLGPIALDGGSQLISQFGVSWLAEGLPYRESTPLLRVLTGLLFGMTTAWFAYPYLEESMAESRQFFLKKIAIAGSK